MQKISKIFLILIVSCFLFFSVFALADKNKKYEVGDVAKITKT